MDDLEKAGRDVLCGLARSLDLPATQFLDKQESPYRVAKLIHYPAVANGQRRSGVAPHVDFSWITLLLQDDTGGLEIRSRDGTWLEVPVVPGTLVVNLGEILEFATRGYYAATPHRVASGRRARMSLPFFLNPALETQVERVELPASAETCLLRTDDDASGHVHRVFSRRREHSFVYGDEEWRRKGLGLYCEACFDTRAIQARLPAP
jgi:isopenicillin N synthase-like dioxygenase